MPERSRPGSAAARKRLLQAELERLRSAAELLLTGGDAAVDDLARTLAAVLELDAVACFSTDGDLAASKLDTAFGWATDTVPQSAVAALVEELGGAGRRSLLLDELRRGGDARAKPFRDLGFTAVAIGRLGIDDRDLGAVVLAWRSRDCFSEAERVVIDIVVSYITAAYERRDLARHRQLEEHRKRDFLTVLAHELRNPLAPVRNALEIIRTNSGARSPVERSAYAMIERQLQQIGRLADDLLDANQAVLGHVQLLKRRVLLGAVVERAVEQSRPWVESARHTVTLELPRDPIALDADPKRLARVFSNLVNYAARRMDRGGRIVLSAAFELGDEVVHVYVRARGRTITDDKLDDVFMDAVEHSEVADGESRGGFTAGLTLVKHLVEMHDGIVSARMAAEGVAEFHVCLPVAAVPAAEQRKTIEPAANEATEVAMPHRILIADDNADSAESMGMLLRLMGNDVRIASDGLEAVEQAEKFQPDIVLMDIGMPRLDGYEAARRIRDQDWSRDTLLVAVTGWGPSDDSEEATAAGFDRHFTKPLDPDELRRLVGGRPAS